MQEQYTRHSTVPFYYLGVEFYLLGRFAFHKRLINSAAVLFHHAIERQLLAELAVGKTKTELKQRYRNHKLDKYWEDLKYTTNFVGKHELDGVGIVYEVRNYYLENPSDIPPLYFIQ